MKNKDQKKMYDVLGIPKEFIKDGKDHSVSSAAIKTLSDDHKRKADFFSEKINEIACAGPPTITNKDEIPKKVLDITNLANGPFLCGKTTGIIKLRNFYYYNTSN